jgi:hypothetical protein
MKKYLPYIIAAVVFLVLSTLLILSARNPVRKFDERISLRYKDKIPYGTYVAYHLLPSLFPNATVYYEKKRPGFWEHIYNDSAHQAVILMAKNFGATETELNKLLEFVQNGNYVFIITRNLSYDAAKFFHFSDNEYYFDQEEDSLQVALQKPPFSSSENFIYPGKKYDSYFTRVDSERTIVLGESNATPDFVQLKAGKGSIYFHLAPLTFSNYFILHKNNVAYFQNALSVIPKEVTTIVWDDYYMTQPVYQNKKEPGLFRVLFKYPEFKWALLTAMFTLLLMVLLEIRRKQRAIPLWEKPKNDSLDFVKTIGRLYYERSDHKNLAKKMAAYFLEHIRSRYKIATHTVDDSFAETVYAKSGYPLAELKRIVHFIMGLETIPEISEFELSHFYQQLESFYQNT